MKRGGLWSLAFFFAWPLVLADVVIRARVVHAFTAVEWTFYGASIILATGAGAAPPWIFTTTPSWKPIPTPSASLTR
jgi:hypothetical protein